MSDASIDISGSLAHDPGLLTSADFGDEWPLTVPYVVIQCHDVHPAGYNLHVLTMTAPDGTIYAVNGTAKSHGGYPEPWEIWAEQPFSGGNRKSLTPVTEAARALCPHGR